MTLTFELAHFSVRDGDEDALIAERPAMVSALREAFPGALAAWLAKQDDGTWLDVILWRSREEARDAAARIDGVAEARRWFRHIGESHGLRHAEVVDERLFALTRRD
jgi:hypothetical protein